MADDSGGFSLGNVFAPVTKFLGDPMISQARSSAGPLDGGYPDAAALLKAKYPKLAAIEGVGGVLDVANLQRDLLAGVLKPKPTTWGEGLGAALQGIGGVLSANRGYNDVGMKMIDSGIASDVKKRNDMIEKLGLTSAIQQAQALGTNMDALVKQQTADAIARKRRQEELGIIAGTPGTIPSPGAGSGTAAPSYLPAPASASIAVPGTAASGVPGMAISVPPTQTTPPVAAPSASSPSVAPAIASIKVPGEPPEIEAMLQRAERAVMLDPKYKEYAEIEKAKALAMRADFMKRYELESEAQRKGATTLSEETAKNEATKNETDRTRAEAATKMGEVFGTMKEHAKVPGMSRLIGPFDNSYVGRAINTYTPWGQDPAVRDRIEGDMAALESLAKPVLRTKGEGAQSDKDAAAIAAAVGTLTNATDERSYMQNLEAARVRIGQILGVKIPEFLPPGKTLDERIDAHLNGTSVKPGTAPGVASTSVAPSADVIEKHTNILQQAAQAKDPKVFLKAVEMFDSQYGKGAAEKVLGYREPKARNSTPAAPIIPMPM